MAVEYEVKVPNIDVEEVEKKLLSQGAKCLGEVQFERYVYDMGENKWLRLRTDGTKSTLTFKSRTSSKIDGTIEHETIVEDFAETHKIISQIKFENLYHQLNKRKIYVLDEIEFSIDTWPGIPIFLEVESSSEEKVIQGLKMLNLEDKSVGNIPLKEFALKYHNVDIDTINMRNN